MSRAPDDDIDMSNALAENNVLTHEQSNISQQRLAHWFNHTYQWPLIRPNLKRDSHKCWC
eukprot:11208360-Lingulodinium_polyedra.AAC.1